MIVSKDIHPERDLYFLGARVIELLEGTAESSGAFLEILQQLNTEEEISMNLYLLTLDWLYLIGVVEDVSEGMIKKCF